LIAALKSGYVHALSDTLVGGSGGLRLPQLKPISKATAISANGALELRSLTNVLNLYRDKNEGFSI
jgi:hypothetical protein